MKENNSLLFDFMTESINGSNLKTMLNIAENILKTPIALCDLTRSILIYSENYPLDDIDDRLNFRKSTPANKRKDFADRSKKLMSDGIPHIVYWPYLRRNQLMCGGLVLGKIAGFITIPSVSIPLETLDVNLIKLIANTLVTALVLNKNISYINSLSQDHDRLWRLLTDKQINDYNFLYWQEFDNISSYRILWFRSMDNKENPITFDTMNYIRSYMNHWWQIPYEDGYAVMIDGNDMYGLVKLNKISQEKGILIGASDIFTNLNDTKENFNLAQNTLLYALIIGKVSGIAYFNDYKIFHLLASANKYVNIQKLQHNAITEIAKYDKENNTEYLSTLTTYIYSNLSIQDAAIKLCIHKNTVSYRISKISKLFNLNLNDINIIVSLYISIMMQNNHNTSNIL